MPLQIRRGTDAERLGSFTPAEGELIYTTDTKKLYVGDGATVGGVAIDTVSGGGSGASTLNDLTDVNAGGAANGNILAYDTSATAWALAPNIIDQVNTLLTTSLAEAGEILSWNGSTYEWIADATGGGGMSVLTDDTAPALGGNLDLNSYDITGTGNIDINGNVTATNFVGTLTGDIIGDLAGTLTGDVLADDDTTVLVNSTTRTFNGDLTGNVTGSVIGDIKGSVFGDDSTPIVDGVNNKLNGNLTGDVSGSIFSDSSQLLVDGINNMVVGDIDNESITTENLLINKTTSPRITLELTSTGDLSSYSGLVAYLGFDTQGSNGSIAYGRIQSWTTGMIIAANDDGSFPASTLNTFSKDGVAIGGVNPTAKLDVRGAIKPGVYANATARDTDITLPVEGMMVFLQDTQKMQVYVTDTGLAGSGPSNSTSGWHDIY